VFDPRRALELGVIGPDEVEDVTAAWRRSPGP